MTKSELFSASDPLSGLFRGRSAVTLGGVPDGLEGRVLARLAEAEGTILFVARDARGVALAETALALLRARHPDADLPGLGQPSLRPRLAQSGNLRAAG